MGPELVLAELFVNVLDLEILHFLGVRRKVDLFAIIRSTIHVVLDTLVVRAELGRLEKQAKGRGLGNMDSLGSWARGQRKQPCGKD